NETARPPIASVRSSILMVGRVRSGRTSSRSSVRVVPRARGRHRSRPDNRAALHDARRAAAMRVFFSWPLGVSDFADDMHRYVQAMERQIAALVQAQQATARTATSSDEHDTQYMLLGKMEETFPRNLRYGALVTIYATV